MEYLRLLAEATAGLVAGVEARDPATLSHRPSMRGVKTLVAAFAAPESPRHRDASVLSAAGPLLDRLERMQRPDGLFDSENLASPPDTCFTVNDAALVLDVIAAHPDPLLEGVAERIRALLLRTVEALLVGGVHTPNHRWELTAGLLRLHALTGDPRLRERADEWLAEGIDLQADGLYSERSPNYAAYVSNPSLLVIAEATGEERYRDAVRRNLAVTLDLLEDDLQVETVQSRRQDQTERFDGRSFLSQFREFAVADGDGRFAAVVRAILDRGVTEPEIHLAEALARPHLAGALSESVPWSSSGTAVFTESGLVRVRAGAVSASVFGGSDVPRHRRIASGLANSAVLVRARRGALVVEAVRVSPHFFGLGPFRPETIVAGPRIALSSRVEVGYHQPLPASARRPDGDYELGSEGRFFGSMSFPARATSTVALETRAEVSVDEHGVELALDFAGTDTSWVGEIVLRPGGVLSGVEESADGAFLIPAGGSARYRVGAETLEIGPGTGSAPDRPPVFDPGELVDYVGGRDRIEGLRLLVTGRTSAPAVLRLRFS
ncbi:hypothetical protein ASF48_16185 [Rathayibacter sp. Leaf299]|uniref:hypothetical protein n=1 Tax=Rathayibacter sp. Leaf299 TaxID=1736328 RepID=UPI0006F99646|nr:hypothetical protein [Rathayibacter sp. Leaf299]KQQ18884.1 hypothetical protein ASF48_16185 [Rathayibacter sp. Leaf299]